MIYLAKTWDVDGLKPYRLAVMGQDFYQTDDALLPQVVGTLIADASYQAFIDIAMAAETW